MLPLAVVAVRGNATVNLQVERPDLDNKGRCNAAFCTTPDLRPSCIESASNPSSNAHKAMILVLRLIFRPESCCTHVASANFTRLEREAWTALPCHIAAPYILLKFGFDAAPYCIGRGATAWD